MGAWCLLIKDQEKVSEAIQIILFICILVMAFILTGKINTWKTKRAHVFIIKDLEAKGAFDLSSAVVLPYTRSNVFRMGMWDFRPKALEYMIARNIVGVTGEGKYYLKNKDVGLFNSGNSLAL